MPPAVHSVRGMQEKIVLIVSLIFLPFFVGDVLSSAIFLSIPTNLWFARWFVFLLVFLFLLCCFSVFLFGLLSFFYFFCMVRSARIQPARLGGCSCSKTRRSGPCRSCIQWPEGQWLTSSLQLQPCRLLRQPCRR